MTKDSDKRSGTDSEACSVRSERASRLGAVLCPVACALLLVFGLAASFIGSKLAYDQYDAYRAARRFDVGKLYIFPNITLRRRS